MKAILLHITLFLIGSGFAFGQIDDDVSSKHDTITPKKLETYQMTNLLSKEIEILDTLQQPDGFILKNLNSETHSIAIANEDRYLVFNLLDYSHIDSISRVDINGFQNQELVIFHSEDRNWSHAESGLSSTNQYMAIFDLDKSEILFNEVISAYENTWGHNEDGDLFDTETLIEYNVEFNKKRIKLEVDRMTLKGVEHVATPIIFEFHGNLLLRKKD